MCVFRSLSNFGGSIGQSFAKARTDIFDLNKSGEVRKQAEASRLAHSQPHMALPRPNPNHSPPDANPPDAKRPKLDTSHLPAYAQGGAGQGSLPPPPPVKMSSTFFLVIKESDAVAV